MFRICKTILISILAFILLFQCGCANSKFEVVAPPVNDFPVAEEYEEAEVIQGNFIVEKNFRGNKKGDKLIVTSDAQTIKGFTIGEKGIISYVDKGVTYEFEAEMVSCPQEGSGDFVAQVISGDYSAIRDDFPGKFAVVVFKEENSLLLAKKAVFPIDENNAIVLQLDEKGTLVEKNITIGQVNETYYQVLGGLNVGEKVVVR